jgi:uncharacterized protein (TIGR02268 family)
MRPSFRRPGRSAALLAALLVGLGADAAPDTVVTTGRRALQRRTLKVTDGNFNEVQVIHVAGGIPTTVSFRQPIRPESVILADTTNAFLPVKASEASIVLIPRKDLGRKSTTTLTVTLADGTILPLLLATVPKEADIGVELDVALVQRAPAESAPVLKAAAAQLRAELDDCRADQGAAGVAKVAGLVLQQDPAQPQVFERHSIGRRDKQERLLVEVRQVYRVFGHSYLLVLLENRDPSRTWVLDHPELASTGGGQVVDIQVASFQMDPAALGPNESGKVVVAFKTPPQGSTASFRLQLLEKNGSRHVTLDGLSL